MLAGSCSWIALFNFFMQELSPAKNLTIQKTGWFKSQEGPWGHLQSTRVTRDICFLGPDSGNVSKRDGRARPLCANVSGLIS